ncbi:hypothetical protein [Flavobacterium selenitireducens]|uniref:hypothetical protein n=1 Tax=Flavobacterium selenitireducens TaxID=2722704 RepID=UPI00168B23B2|nr:hypothetical protein [Flavobacterium selenitireducens]MBD3582700.1 hypothetical protein [Flavobacterium selenitireducens]
MRATLRLTNCLVILAVLLVGGTSAALAQATTATWAGTSNLNAVTNNATITASAVTASGVTGLSSSTNGVNSASWTTSSAMNDNDYYQFQITPSGLNAFTFTGITFRRSGSSGSTWGGAVYYSTNGFTSRTQIGVNYTFNSTEAAFTQNNLSVVVSPGTTLTIRVYAWNAPDGWFDSQNFRVKSLVVSGTSCSGPSFTTQPSGGSFCAGTTLTMTAAANGATGYQWKKDNVNINGATSATFTKNNITAADAGSYTVVANNACTGNTSNAAVVAVVAIPTSVTANASATSVCAGSSVNLTASSVSNTSANTTLINENFNAATNAWVKVNNSTGGTVANAAWTLRPNGYLIPDATQTYSNDNSQFYLSNSDQQNSSSSNTLTTLTSPAFSTLGLSSGSISFYHYFRSYQNSNVKVQVSSNGTSWTDLETYTNTQGTSTAFANATLALPAAFLNQASVYLRFRYSAIDGWFWAIDNVLVTGVIANAPAAYAWTSTPAGFTSNLQNPTVTPTQNTTYTVTVTNSNNCSVSASTAMVIVNPVSIGGSVSGGTTVCGASNSGTLTLAGHTGTIVRWESSTDNFATAGIPIANATTTLNYSNLSVTTSYRAVVQSGSCASANSASATVSFTAPSVVGTLAGDATHCSNTNSGTLTLSGYTGASLGWEYSHDNFATAGVPIVNNGATFNYSNLTATTSYRVAVGNGGGCPSQYCNVITIAINNNSTWTGATSAAWNEPTNWSCGEVPQSYTNVTIAPAANQPVITSDAFAKTLTLQPGTLLSLLSNDLTVTDVIASAGSFTIANNANLIQINDVDNTGVVKVKRNSSALMRQDYTLWSSPVNSQNLLTFSSQTLTNRFYTYNSTNNQYAAVANPNATAFAEGTSYLIRMPNNHPTTPTVWNGEFNGVLRNGNVNVPMNNGGEGFRYNALGNPYPSPISMTAFANDNAANITGTLYFWRKTNNPVSPSYCTWTAGGGFVTNGEAQVNNPNDVIRTGQGFIVEASAAGTQAVFNNGQRSGNNGNQFFRQVMAERHRIWLNASTAAGAFCQTLVGYIEGSTLGNDAQIDGRFFNDGEISFYSLISDERFAIQGRPVPFENTDVVPMGFKATTAGSFSISIAEADGLFLEGQDVFVRDNLTNTVHDLNSGAYTFVSEAGTFNNRFDILYQNALGTDTPVLDSNAVVVYKQQGHFIINSGNVEMTSVQVYDVLGKLVKTVNGINSGEVSFPVTGASQMLIFKIATAGNGEVVKKVMN